MFKIWVRPKDGPVDVLFALMCGDISVPACYAVGRRGWAPTVQMTAYLRGMPDPGWLRVSCTTTQIGQDWFDEDHTVVDSAGASSCRPVSSPWCPHSDVGALTAAQRTKAHRNRGES